MKKITCQNCHRFLGEIAYGDLMIKCRCGAENYVKMISAKHLLLLTTDQEQVIMNAEAHRGYKAQGQAAKAVLH